MKLKIRSFMATPPRAPQLPQKLVHHGHERYDEYYGLRDRDDPQVLEYLQKENSYRQEEMKHTLDLQEELYREIRGRIVEEDQSVPYFKRGYWYYVRFQEGQEQPIYARKKESLEQPEELLIDANEGARQHDYYKVGGLSVSPDNKCLAYGIDTVGRRLYTIYFKDIATGEQLEEFLPETTGSGAWSACGQYIFYSVKDETLRPHAIFRHRIGTPATEDVELFREEDPTYVCGVSKTKSQAYILIGSHSTVADEYQYLSASSPTEAFQTFLPRERGHEHGIAHAGDHWYIRTNRDQSPNFKLMRAPLNDPGKRPWEEVIPHRKEVFLEDVELFRHYLVTEERRQGLSRLCIRPWSGAKSHELDFPSETYTAGIGYNPDYESSLLRYGYSSLTTPPSVYDYHMEERSHELRKQLEIKGGYDESLYQSERIWATAPDGTEVPISLVYRRDMRQAAGNPLLLIGYGSYGITVDPGFSSTRLSLLDRGFTVAIAHVRGGQYLGRAWYEEGKLLRKKNTFTDYIACAEYLLKHKYSRRDRLFGLGGSAGGLLIGAVINQRPELFRGVIAAVPFVDVLTTMLDESIPLTTGEYDEWGNPQDPDYYHYIHDYSPYDQVKEQSYPAMLVTTGLHDSQVQFWEPAKWVARLRDRKQDKQPLYLYVNMQTGHGGASGRFEAIRETALEYAFLLDLLAKPKPSQDS